VVGRGDVDRINILLIEQPSEILIPARVRTGPLLGSRGIRHIDIGGPAVLDARRFAHQSRHVPAATTAADKPHDDAVIRADHTLGRERSHGAAADEMPSLHVLIITPPTETRGIMMIPRRVIIERRN
jgi:hypothetical protein